MKNKFFLGSGGKFAYLNNYQGGQYIHVRYFDKDVSSQRPFPTKRGVMMTPVQYSTLMMYPNKIDINLKTLSESENESENREARQLYVRKRVKFGSDIWVVPSTLP